MEKKFNLKFVQETFGKINNVIVNKNEVPIE